MSNSKLVKYIDTNHTHWSTRTDSIYRITIHRAAGNLDFDGYSSTLRSRDCSWNYAIQSDGHIGLFVDESHRAWTSGGHDPRGRLNDFRAITMEVSDIYNAKTGEWFVTDMAYNAVLDLCEDICRRYNKTTLLWLGDKELSESYVPKPNEMIITVHQWYMDTDCPGKYLYSRLSNIASTVTRRLGGNNNLTYNTSPVVSAYTTAAVGTLYQAPGELSIASNATPYVLSTSQRTGNINYSKFKELGVSCVMLQLGQLYDAVHKETDSNKYMNNNLDKQIREATSASIPYGYWHPVKARNVDEAYKEASAIVRTVRLKPAKVGIWLKLELVKSKSINDAIIEAYRKTLAVAGLTNQLGIYATSEQLEKISWDNYKEHFLLWLDEPNMQSTASKHSTEYLSAIIYQAPYISEQIEPSILSTDTKISVINYTSIVAALFNASTEPAPSTEVILDKLVPTKREIVQFFIGYGLPVSAAVGITANLQYLSRCRAAATDGYKNGVPTQFGICKWSGNRSTAMRSYVGSNWKSNLTGQLKFMYHELVTNYHALLMLLRVVPNNASGVQQAADAVIRNFTRPVNLNDAIAKCQTTASELWGSIVIQLL